MKETDNRIVYHAATEKLAASRKVTVMAKVIEILVVKPKNNLMVTASGRGLPRSVEVMETGVQPSRMNLFA